MFPSVVISGALGAGVDAPMPLQDQRWHVFRLTKIRGRDTNPLPKPTTEVTRDYTSWEAVAAVVFG